MQYFTVVKLSTVSSADFSALCLFLFFLVSSLSGGRSCANRTRLVVHVACSFTGASGLEQRTIRCFRRSPAITAHVPGRPGHDTASWQSLHRINRSVHIVLVFLATFALGDFRASVARRERNHTDSLVLSCNLKNRPGQLGLPDIPSLGYDSDRNSVPKVPG
ncbi:hypothetical protein F5B21DRAFT_416353 [Xylaria acuta]|nr:hypothetical protein F5B21DRAFT_416353 [Xylaria acuta]